LKAKKEDIETGRAHIEALERIKMLVKRECRRNSDDKKNVNIVIVR
jgi:hypothetical protein